MSATPTFLCTHYAPDNGPRCTANATRRLLDEGGCRVPGGIYCEAHATEIIDEIIEKLGWNFSTQPLEEAL